MGRHGRPKGRTRGIGAGHKRNIREPCAPVLRRDKSASTRLHMIHRLEELLQTEDVTMATAPASLKRRMESRFGEDWRSTKSMVAKKDQYQHYVASRRLGKNGVRPFGSRGSTSIRKQSQGARMRSQQSLTQQPLLGVFQTIRKWFLKERRH